MKPARLFLLLSTLTLSGIAISRPADVGPLVGRFVEPLLADPSHDAATAPTAGTSAPSLPNFVSGSRDLTFSATRDAAPSAPAVPAASSEPPPSSPAPATDSPASTVAAAVSAAPPPSAAPSAPATLPPVTVTVEVKPPAASPSPGVVMAALPSPGIIRIEPLPQTAVPVPTVALATAPVAAKSLFGSVKTGAPMAARAIGTYSRGCLAGGVALPVDGPAWQAMRLSRNRNWGHPQLISLVEKFATDAKKLDAWPGLLVGDISQPRGGPMLTGHASHQLGLDADVWFTPMPDRRLSDQEREDLSATSMLDATGLAVNPKVFGDAQVRLIKRAASYPQVERVLVHPAIKKALCLAAGPDRRWLGKVRPIGGHYYHFHIRIACPPGSMTCKPQRPPTGDDGCAKEVDQWLARLAPPKVPPLPKPPGYKPPPPAPPITMAQLPTECTAVLQSGPGGVTTPDEAVEQAVLNSKDALVPTAEPASAMMAAEPEATDTINPFAGSAALKHFLRRSLGGDPDKP